MPLPLGNGTRCDGVVVWGDGAQRWGCRAREWFPTANCGKAKVKGPKTDIQHGAGGAAGAGYPPKLGEGPVPGRDCTEGHGDSGR